MVYVDEAKHKLGRMVMCHMVADTAVELQRMACMIGVSWKHLQCAGTYREHLDVCKSKRSLALSEGAVEVTSKELVQIIWRKK